MTKFYRRTGVTAFRFLIEAQIQKIDLKLPKPDIYSQRISVIFKRGELRKETHNAPLMEDGQAYFAEKLSVPAVLYYDKRKKLFLPKEATLAVNLISKRNTKLMGVTRFDLATFVNNDIQEKDVVLKMEKCPDKNAKFHFRLVITQIKELGSTRPSMKMSIKESVRSGSIRSSFKDASLFSLRESFKDTTMPLSVFAAEQPKLSTDKKTNEDIDELYSYCTDSECSEEKIPEIAEFEVPAETIGGDTDGLACMTDSFAADQLRASQNKPEFCNVSTLEKTFSHSTYSSPNKNEIKIIEDLSEDLQPQPEVYTLNPLEPPQLSQSPDMRNKRAQNTKDLEQKVSTYEKEIVNLSNILLSGSQEFSSLKENHEQLKQDYETLNKKYEALIHQKSIQSPLKSEDGESQARIMELENKLQQAESQNDLMTKLIQELEKTNQDYIVKLEKSIEKQAQPVYYNPQPNNIHQYKNMIDDVVHRLKEYKSIKVHDIQSIEGIMQELVNKLNESQESLLQLKENTKLEKQKGQREMEALEQGLQRLIREHETLKVKRQIKELQGETSYDNVTHHHSQTMSFNSLKTREESLFDEQLQSAHDLSDHQGSGVKMHSGIFENAKTVSKSENAALKQEINYLSAKLLTMVNIQSKFEEQIKQRQHLQIENKSLKSDLDKANKGWAYAEEERYELANKLKNTSSMNVSTEDTEYLEFEVFKLKSKMAEMLNAVMEFGGADLSDKVEAIMTSQAGLNMENGNNFMSFA